MICIFLKASHVICLLDERLYKLFRPNHAESLEFDVSELLGECERTGAHFLYVSGGHDVEETLRHFSVDTREKVLVLLQAVEFAVEVVVEHGDILAEGGF